MVTKTNASQILYDGGTGAVATTVEKKLQEIVSVADNGVISDGLTDQTAKMVALLSTLGAEGYRGWMKVPHNTKFDVQTVYAAVPIGVILDDESSINWGKPPGYKNKFRIMFSGDTTADDTQQIIASGHNTGLMLLNMGTSGTASGNARTATILHGVGRNFRGDPLLAWIHQFGKSSSGDLWRASMRIQCPYNVAIKNPQPWNAAIVYPAGAYCVSDGSKIYTTAAGGTSGATAPSGTGTGINDGGVLWNYVQANLTLDSTRFAWDEDGKSQQNAPVGGIARHEFSAGGKSFYLEIADSTGTITFRDVTRGRNILSVSDASGLQIGTFQSHSRAVIGGETPNAPATGSARVSNASATNMTDMVMPAGAGRMVVNLRFADGNTTMVHGSGMQLKGGVNVTPIANSFMTLEKDTSVTSLWYEVSRSF